MQSVTSGVLMEFQGEVTRQRECLFAGVSDFPAPLRDVIIANYKSRVARGHGKPLLGECAPWLMAEILPIRDRTAVGRVIQPWMDLYAYTLFIDDIIDVTEKADALPLMLASQLLLERGLSRLYAVLPMESGVRVHVDAYFLEAATAVLAEFQEHRGHLKPYSSEDVDRLGQKVAFLKLCASCLLSMDGRQPDDHETLLLPVGALATGMQLLDDIADWEEDFRARNFTPLLTMALAGLESDAPETPQCLDTLTPRDVMVRLITTGALENHIALGLSWLETVAAAPGLSPSSLAACLLAAVIDENLAVCDQVRAIRLACEATCPGGGVRSPLLDRAISRRIDAVSTELRIVAQNS